MASRGGGVRASGPTSSLAATEHIYRQHIDPRYISRAHARQRLRLVWNMLVVYTVLGVTLIGIQESVVHEHIYALPAWAQLLVYILTLAISAFTMKSERITVITVYGLYVNVVAAWGAGVLYSIVHFLPIVMRAKQDGMQPSTLFIWGIVLHGCGGVIHGMGLYYAGKMLNIKRD